MDKQLNSKCIIPLSMLYLCIMVSSELLVSKPVVMPFGYTTAATLIFPLWFVLNDIIAEVYGYKLCWRILCLGFLTTLLFNLISIAAINLPSPTDWHQQFSFDYIYGHLLHIEFSTFIAFLVSGLINIRLLTKWKILMSGKYFCFRSIGSSIIGEAIYSSLNVWMVFIGTTTSSSIFSIMFWSFFLKVFCTILFAYPAMFIVQLLKRIDKFDNYDGSTAFSSFTTFGIKKHNAENTH